MRLEFRLQAVWFDKLAPDPPEGGTPNGGGVQDALEAKAVKNFAIRADGLIFRIIFCGGIESKLPTNTKNYAMRFAS